MEPLFHSIQSGPVELRLMREDDPPLLLAWLNRPHVAEWWGNERATFDVVREKYPIATGSQRGQ